MTSEHILLVDDDEIFISVLARALKRRGFTTFAVTSSAEAISVMEQNSIDKAVVDLNLIDESGLKLIPLLKNAHPSISIVMLTGYSSISTAVEAIKLGATNYLCKPADADEIMAAFESAQGNPDLEIAPTPLSVDRLEWEHIQKVLHENNGNISATARALGMHRRTLQRKLQKRPVKR